MRRESIKKIIKNRGK
jgi:hypothetical protein